MTLPRLLLLLSPALMLLLIACSARDAEQTPTPVPTDTPAASSPTAEPTSEGTAPADDPTPSTGPAESLEALVLATIPESAMHEGDEFFGFEGVKAFPLDRLQYEADGALWGVTTIGAPGDDPFTPHFIAVYLSQHTGWELVDKIELPNAEQIFESSVRVVDIEPSRYWIEVDSAVGVHGGYYELLSYDGATLRSEVSGFSSGPAAGESHDINGDGVLEVLVNANDPYVFCYACGVIDLHTDIYRWDGSQVVSVQLETVDYDDDIPADDPILANNAAVGLARAFRWKEALALVDAHELRFEEGTISWNAHYISLNANAKLGFAEEAPFPFLQHVFAGDFDAAYEILKEHPPEETFTAEPSFFDQSPAEDAGDIVSAEVLAITDTARFSEPERVSIIAVHAWALYLANPGEPRTLAELQAAVILSPDDQYLAAAVAYLTP